EVNTWIFRLENTSTPQKRQETKEGVHELLKAIWTPFVAKIDIHQSDLVDALISCGIINDDDNESLSGSHLPTRHERASDVTRHFRTAPPNWHEVFRAFENLPRPTASRLQPEMEKILSTHDLHVPCDLVDLMTQGLPCRCSLAIGSSMDSLKKTRRTKFSLTTKLVATTSGFPATTHMRQKKLTRKYKHLHKAPNVANREFPPMGLVYLPRWTWSCTELPNVAVLKVITRVKLDVWTRGKNGPKRGRKEPFSNIFSERKIHESPGRTKHMSVRLPLDDTKLVTAILRELLGKEDVKENVTSDQSYVSGTPDAKGYSIPDRLGTSIRDTQGTSIPDTQGTVIADTQGSTIPHTQDINIPDSQGTGTPDTQGTGIPDSQGSSIPESQDTSSSDMQGTFEQSDTVREQSRPDREPSVEYTLPTGRCSAVSTRSCHRGGTFPRPSTHRRPQVQQERSALGTKRCQTVGRQGGAHTADMLNLRTESVSAAAVSPQSQTENIVRGAKSQTLSSQAAGGDELSASANSRVFGSQADDAWAPPGVNLTKNLRDIQTTLYKGEYERQQNTGVVSEWTVCSTCTSFLATERQNYEHNWDDEDEETNSHRMSEVVPFEHSYTDGIGESDHTSNQGNQNQPEESDAVQTRDLEAARQNNDLKHLHEYVTSEVTIDELAELLRRAAVLNVDARNNLSDLIHDHYEQEQLYQDLCETLYNIVDKLQSGDYESSTEIQQHLADIDHFCKDLLDYGRTLILCSIYLEITTKLTTERTCLKADQAAGDLLVLIECAVLDVTGKLHSVRKGLENTDIDRCLCDEFGSKVWSFLDGV
ncbi:hypothetical protein BaRGS_00039126, partial [Batillaria attramentaria]